ncbi:hypothetical protein PR048_032458 [Dryococelus australis]|uniref:Uncharacterized protein n=1 Tax=Dryococelus australis TaxID=614101 RepID=A0ABQ9G323_9NEOP|nr:hypothetical protein PR048_032458 [Dryococelus australis]
MARLPATHLGEMISIPVVVTPEFSHVGIVPDDASGWRVFSGFSRLYPQGMLFRCQPENNEPGRWRLRDTETTATHRLRAPFAVLDAEQLVGEPQVAGEFLQQVDAEAGAALEQRAVLPRRLHRRNILEVELKQGVRKVRSHREWTILSYSVFQRCKDPGAIDIRNPNQGAGKRETPEKTRRPTATSGTIPTCENPVARPGSEPGTPWWEASAARAQRLACSPPAKVNRGSIPGRVAPNFRKFGIVPDDAACRRGFLGYLPFPPSLRSGAAPYVASPPSALKPMMLRAAHIFSLTSFTSVFRADEGKARYVATLNARGGKRDIPEKTRRPAALFDTIPTCENSGTTQLTIEPRSPWWETSSLTTKPQRSYQAR